MRHRRPILDRRHAVAELLKPRGNTLVVTGLGAPTWDATAAGDHPLTFHIWGGMGGNAKTRNEYLWVDHIFIAGKPM